MKEYRNTELEKLLEKAEELRWNYNLYKENNGYTYAELQRTSPLGEDFIMTIDFSEENPTQSFLYDLKNYAENFDYEEYAETWIEMRGKNGVPSSIAALLKDAVVAQKK